MNIYVVNPNLETKNRHKIVHYNPDFVITVIVKTEFECDNQGVLVTCHITDATITFVFEDYSKQVTIKEPRTERHRVILKYEKA